MTKLIQKLNGAWECETDSNCAVPYNNGNLVEMAA